MKKYLFFLITLLIPLNVFSYSDYIIPGGQSVGISVNNKGIMIVGFYKVANNLNKNKLRIGDIITKVNGEEVVTINELVKSVEKYAKDNKVLLTIKRNNKEFEKDFELINNNGTYKTGLYVKDSITGIGTLTYIDPETKIFGALGHEIADSISGSIVEIKDGTIYKSVITSIDKGQRGIAGAKNAKFYSNDKYGDINKNSKVGIYGLYNKDISGYKTLKVGDLDSIKLGKAYIYTVLDGENIEKYEIIIDNVNYGLTKNIHFEIISDELINKTGGIIQGMSGSPIVQNDLIIGAVTHVIVDNPTTGYGVSIINMLKEGER